MKIRNLFLAIISFLGIIFSQNVLAATNQPDLKQEIGQMVMLGFEGSKLNPNDSIVKDILAQRVGGIILFDKAFSKKDISNIKSPQQLKKLTQALQNYAQQAAQTNQNHLYPLFIGIDYEGGKVNQLKEKFGFPKTISAAKVASGNLKNAQVTADRMATTLKNEGINLDFAPVLDVNVNPKNPIIAKYGRSFSSDPNKVATYAEVYAKAFRDAGVMCAYKHFPGHGSSKADSHKGFVDITKTWQSYELDPYRKLFQLPDSCDFVMVGHLINRQLDPDDYPASLSNKMITGVLRDQLGFKGLVITDDLQMKAISDHYPLADTVRLAINGGADVLLFANQLPKSLQDAQTIVDMIYADVQSGKIPRQRIDEAYNRIMGVKGKM